MKIHDHGELDFLTPSAPTDVDLAVVRHINNVLELHRAQLNDRDKARQAAANEREIARWLGGKA
jgi:hypothetical protein